MAPHLIWFLSEPLISRGRCRHTGKSAYPLLGVMPYMVLRNRPGSITLPIFTFIRKYGETIPLPNPVPLQILPSPIPILHSLLEGTAGAASCPDANLRGKAACISCTQSADPPGPLPGGNARPCFPPFPASAKTPSPLPLQRGHSPDMQLSPPDANEKSLLSSWAREGSGRRKNGSGHVPLSGLNRFPFPDAALGRAVNQI